CITDYDCWHIDQATESVSIEMIIQNLLKNVDVSKRIIKLVLPKLSKDRNCVCASALKDSIITRPDAIPAKTKKELELIIGKYVR
ncbi:MAG: S-methyl-5'-thioadenosine phosphorylase, partial [Candidatus Omnitrophota bacterium]|nr:S-methyl-5'-thioadenosine phosphorylase [Candidatus Omnitrophota bacterium]